MNARRWAIGTGIAVGLGFLAGWIAGHVSFERGRGTWL